MAKSSLDGKPGMPIVAAIRSRLDRIPPTHKMISSPRFIATLKKLSFFFFLVRTIDAKKGGRKNP